MSRMAHSFFDAAIGEESWPRALARLASSFGGFESNFMVWDRTRSRVDFSAWAEFTDETSKSYSRCEALIQSRRGQVILTQNLPDEVFLRDEIYNEFLRPLGTRYLMGLKLADSGSRVSMLRIHRHASNGPYSSADARKLNQLFPNFSRAARLHLNEIHAKQKAAVSAAALDQLQIGVIVIDRGWRVLHANALAQDAFAEGSSLWVLDGRLVLGCAEADAALRCSIGEACDVWGDPLQITALGLQRFWAGDYELSVSTFADDSSLVVRATSEVFLITLKRREWPLQDLTAALKSRFALTNTEACVVEQITQGRTLQQIAAHDSKSINTIKTHLKAVFTKMEVRSQSDLVRVVLMSRHTTN